MSPFTLRSAAGAPPVTLTGFTAHTCVSATARAAIDPGFESTVVSDATATRSLPSATFGSPVAMLASRPEGLS